LEAAWKSCALPNLAMLPLIWAESKRCLLNSTPFL
jgi:hypothetical protein